MKPPILVLAQCLADGTDYLDYEIMVPSDQLAATAHRMLLAAENEARSDNNRLEPDDLMELVTAENSPLVEMGGMYWLDGVGADGDEGFRVFQVPKLGG